MGVRFRFLYHRDVQDPRIAQESVRMPTGNFFDLFFYFEKRHFLIRNKVLFFKIVASVKSYRGIISIFTHDMGQESGLLLKQKSSKNINQPLFCDISKKSRKYIFSASAGLPQKKKGMKSSFSPEPPYMNCVYYLQLLNDGSLYMNCGNLFIGCFSDRFPGNAGQYCYCLTYEECLNSKFVSFLS